MYFSVGILTLKWFVPFSLSFSHSEFDRCLCYSFEWRLFFFVYLCCCFYVVGEIDHVLEIIYHPQMVDSLCKHFQKWEIHTHKNFHKISIYFCLRIFFSCSLFVFLTHVPLHVEISVPVRTEFVFFKGTFFSFHNLIHILLKFNHKRPTKKISHTLWFLFQQSRDTLNQMPHKNFFCLKWLFRLIFEM